MEEDVATFEEMLDASKDKIILFVELKGNTADYFQAIVWFGAEYFGRAEGCSPQEQLSLSIYSHRFTVLQELWTPDEWSDQQGR